MNQPKIDPARLAKLDAGMDELARNVLICRKLRGKQVIRDDEAQAFVDLLREWRAWKSGGDGNPKIFSHFVDRAKTFEKRMQDRGYDRYRDVGASWQLGAGATMPVPPKVAELAKRIPNAETARELFAVAERNLRNGIEAASRLPGWPSGAQVAAHELVLNTQRYLNRVSREIPISGPLSSRDAQRAATAVVQSEKSLILIRENGGTFINDILKDFQHGIAVALAAGAKAIVSTAKEVAKEVGKAVIPEIPAWLPVAGIGLALAWLSLSSPQEKASA